MGKEYELKRLLEFIHNETKDINEYVASVSIIFRLSKEWVHILLLKLLKHVLKVNSFLLA